MRDDDKLSASDRQPLLVVPQTTFVSKNLKFTHLLQPLISFTDLKIEKCFLKIFWKS